MRARHAAKKLKSGKVFSKTYKDEKQVQAEMTLQAYLVQHQPAEPMEGQIALGVRCYMPIPMSKPKAFQSGALAGTIRPITKPDLDNMLKHVKDCLSNMRFWKDDNQVVEYLPGTGKWYSDRPRWEIEIQPV
jgi:Holliday junction resolvase RusA-like endonuclease